MTEFVSWDMFVTYTEFVFFVFAFVEFTKELPLVTKIKTKYYSAVVAFAMMILVNLHAETFALWDLMLYVFTAIIISLTSNGISDFNDHVIKKDKIK